MSTSIKSASASIQNVKVIRSQFNEWRSVISYVARIFYGVTIAYLSLILAQQTLIYVVENDNLYNQTDNLNIQSDLLYDINRTLDHDIMHAIKLSNDSSINRNDEAIETQTDDLKQKLEEVLNRLIATQGTNTAAITAENEKINTNLKLILDVQKEIKDLLAKFTESFRTSVIKVIDETTFKADLHNARSRRFRGLLCESAAGEGTIECENAKYTHMTSNRVTLKASVPI